MTLRAGLACLQSFAFWLRAVQSQNRENRDVQLGHNAVFAQLLTFCCSKAAQTIKFHALRGLEHSQPEGVHRFGLPNLPLGSLQILKDAASLLWCSGARLAAAPAQIEARVTTPRDRRKKRHLSIRRKVLQLASSGPDATVSRNGQGLDSFG